MINLLTIEEPCLPLASDSYFYSIAHLYIAPSSEKVLPTSGFGKAFFILTKKATTLEIKSNCERSGFIFLCTIYRRTA